MKKTTAVIPATATASQTILRYVLTVVGENVVMTYPGAIPTFIQPHKKGVEMYFLVNAEVLKTEPEPRRFFVATTGQTVEEPSTYRGTAGFPGMKSRHVFELA